MATPINSPTYLDHFSFFTFGCWSSEAIFHYSIFLLFVLLGALCLYFGLCPGVAYICLLGFFSIINNFLFNQWSFYVCVCICVYVIRQKEFLLLLTKKKKKKKLSVSRCSRFEDCESVKLKHLQKLSDLLLVFVLLRVLSFLLDLIITSHRYTQNSPEKLK